MAAALILISSRADDQAFGAAVAAAAGLEFRQASDPAAGMKLVVGEEAPILFVDGSGPEEYRRFEAAAEATVGLYSSKVAANRVHYLSSSDIYKVPHLIASPLFGSYIRRNFDDLASVSAHYGRVLAAGVGQNAFGTERLVRPGCRIQTIRPTSSLQKRDAVEAVRSHLIALKFQSRMATVVANAVDELLMNAMYDAPVDPAGRPLYSGTARNTAIDLSGRSAVELHVAYDGEYVTVTAVDLFGSLDKGRLMGAISSIYRKQEYKVRTAGAGAGLGLATVFHSGGSFLFSSENGVRTEATVFFRRTDNFRDFKNQFRFISTQFYF